MLKQLTLFGKKKTYIGTKQKVTLHIKVPFQDMSALWRDCLRANRNNNKSTKKELGISTWNSEGVPCHFLEDKKKLDFFYFSA